MFFWFHLRNYEQLLLPTAVFHNNPNTCQSLTQNSSIWKHHFGLMEVLMGPFTIF